MLDRDVPADETRGGGIRNALRGFRLENEKLGTQFPNLFRAKQAEDFRNQTGEKLNFEF